MSTSFRSSIGRCDGVIHPVSVRAYYLAGASSSGLSTRRRLETPLERGQSVEDWLAAHPRIRDRVSWEHEAFLGLASTNSAYTSWSGGSRSSLQRAVDHYAGCSIDPLADPPSNRASRADDEIARQRYSNVDAFRWYQLLLAQTLVVEMGRWVPWSLEDYDDDELFYLLDSRSLFSWQPGDSYEVRFGVHGPAVPAEPRFTYEFLYGNDLIAPTRVETIARLIDWCRWNLRHFSAHRVEPDTYVGGDYTTLSMDLHWRYRGFPPARRVVEGTTRRVTDASAHWTAGCHGTVGFLRAILRAVNIPVAYVRRCRHAMPRFLHEELYLSHGDDPYNRCAKREDLPARDLLIDHTTFEDYFDGADACDNVGQGVHDATADLPVLPELPDSCSE